MEKLFDETEGVTTIRPTSITKYQEKKMFSDFAKEVIKQKYSDDDEETIAEDLKSISFCDTGYEIAKHLEQNGNASYEIDTEFIGWLDWIGYERNNILQENIKLWVKANNPTPKFKAGQKLIVKKTLNREQRANDIIYITAIREETANYLVDRDPNRQGGYVISYELIESNCKIID